MNFKSLRRIAVLEASINERPDRLASDAFLFFVASLDRYGPAKRMGITADDEVQRVFMMLRGNADETPVL